MTGENKSKITATVMMTAAATKTNTKTTTCIKISQNK
jgi:hypothetical protein